MKFLSTNAWKLCSQHKPVGIETVVNCFEELITFTGIFSFLLTLHFGQTSLLFCRNLSFPILTISEVVMTNSSHVVQIFLFVCYILKFELINLIYFRNLNLCYKLDGST